MRHLYPEADLPYKLSQNFGKMSEMRHGRGVIKVKNMADGMTGNSQVLIRPSVYQLSRITKRFGEEEDSRGPGLFSGLGFFIV